MGYATVVSGGEDGRYTIEIDTGEWRRVELLAAVNAAISQLEIQLVDAQAKLDEAEAKEQTQRDAVQYEIDAYAAAAADLPPGTTLPQAEGITFELNKLRALQVNHQPLRTLIDALKFDLAEARKQAAVWNTLQALETRQAWCADLTEDREPGSQVGTIEIPGEPKIVVVAPGARNWYPPDGFLLSRELQRPDQLFVNAALLPGVSKWNPTYRWGTVTSKDDEANLMNVTLGSATATGRNLSLNVRTSLVGVPVTYMACNSKAFEIGDRCIVQFVDGDWENPRVIGFLDNPRACGFEVTVQSYISASAIVGDPALNDDSLTIDAPVPSDPMYIRTVDDPVFVVVAPAQLGLFFDGWYRFVDGARSTLLTRSRTLVLEGITEDLDARARYVRLSPIAVQPSYQFSSVTETAWPTFSAERVNSGGEGMPSLIGPTFTGPTAPFDAIAYIFPSFTWDAPEIDGLTINVTYEYSGAVDSDLISDIFSRKYTITNQSAYSFLD